MAAVARGDQLCRDTHAIAGPADAAFKDVLHAERIRNTADVVFLASEGECGRSSDDRQAWHVRQCVDDLFGQPVTEVFVFLVSAHVRERQHRDGGSGMVVARREGMMKCFLELFARLKAILGRLCETTCHDPSESCWNRNWQGPWFVTQDRAQSLSRRVAGKGAHSCEHFVEDSAEAENVGARIEHTAISLLRRHVCRGSYQSPDSSSGHIRRVVCQPGQT